MASGGIPQFDDFKPKAITVTGKVPNFDDYVPVPDHVDRSVRDHLKDEGFLDSVWNVVKSPVSILYSLASGEYAKSGSEDRKRADELQQSGTPEQRREFAKEIILKNIPGASTIYKATHGNVSGAAGDVTGALVLGGLIKGTQKTADAAGTIREIVTDPAVVKAARAAIPKKYKLVIDAADAAKNRISAGRRGPVPESFTEPPVQASEIIGERTVPAAPASFTESPIQASEILGERATAAAPAPVVETPGMVLARQSGQDWAKLSASDRGMLETVAQAQANAAAQPPNPPESTPPAAPAPEPAPVVPPTGGRPAAAEIAAQLEASMRAETLTDYLVRNKVPAAMLDDFGPEQWDMVSRQAGVKPPSLEDVAAIRGNLAQYEGASEITAKTPAEAAAEFETKKATRNARKPKTAPEPPADVESQLADSLAAVEKGERPVAPAPAEQPRAATASDKRVEAYAQHFAADPGTAIADIEPLTKLPDFPKLGRALEIDGALAPGEAERIAARVQELRAEAAAAPLKPTPIAQAKADFEAAKATAPPEVWQIPKSQLVPNNDTVPRPKVAHDPSGGYTEAEINARALRNRAAETQPPDITRHPVGSWGTDSTGELMQLREYSLDDPKLVFTETPGKNPTVRKYMDWINEGNEPPPLRGLETEKGNIRIQEGNHRAAAVRETGGNKVKVWTVVTRNRPIGGGQVMGEGLTHEAAVRTALAEGKPVPAEVLADYPDLVKPAEPAAPTTLRELMQPKAAEPPAAPRKTPATMSAAELNRRLDQLDKKSSQLTDQFLEEGRGQERPSDYSKKTDPLSSAMNAVHSELSDLRSEIARRYGPNAPSRLPRGFGPVKSKR